MKIIQLKSSNIKRLKAVELTLDKDQNLVMITGKNAQGKTSVLDSIWYALGGKKVLPEKPIREGEEKAEIEINMDGYIIKRSFTDKGSYLTVLNKEGQKFSNSQEFLDYVVGTLSFDPLAFTRLSGKKQVDTLAQTVGLDLTEFDTRKKSLTEERVGVGREKKAIATHTEEQVVAAQKATEELKDIPSTQDAVNAVNQSKAEWEHFKKAQARKIEIDEQIKKLQTEKDELNKIPEPKSNLEELQTRLATLEQDKKAYDEAQRVLMSNKAVEVKQAEYDELTKQIRAVEQEKADALSSVKMPIDGLSWNDESVTYNDIPYNQISGAEQLRVSMAIAMAANPKLKVIIIKDGSLLDVDNLKSIEELAKKNDFQVWVESVDDSGKVGVYIEDGEIKTINK